jgi:cell division protein FtsL
MNINNDNDIKKALAKAAQMRFAQELKSANEKERPFTKAYLAQKLHKKGHFDLTLCNKTLDTLSAALFDEQSSETPPALTPQQQAAQKPAAEPAIKKTPRRITGKWTYILQTIILTLLIVIAAEVFYLVLHAKPETPSVQEYTTEQEAQIEQEVQPDQTNPDRDENE